MVVSLRESRSRVPVICMAKRTLFGRHRGAYAGLRIDDVTAGFFNAFFEAAPFLNPSACDEVILGCSGQAGEDARNLARKAWLKAELPEHIPAVTVNRLCGSGLSALQWALMGIWSGLGRVYWVGGMEGMSRSVEIRLPEPFGETDTFESSVFGPRLEQAPSLYPWMEPSHLSGAEALAKRFSISREEQEAWALRSHQRGLQAWQEGLLSNEILFLPERFRLTLKRDECLRETLTQERLQKLRPLQEGGTVTVATATPFSDGWVGLCVADKAYAQAQGWPIVAEIVGFSNGACPPLESGLELAHITQQVLQQAGNRLLEEISVLEWHEPFAVSVLASARQCGFEAIEEPRLNARGGALGFGSPVGACGLRLVASACSRLQQAKPDALGLIALSIGMGQSTGLLLKRG
jgi:acetyl-CoA acyltransferase